MTGIYPRITQTYRVTTNETLLPKEKPQTESATPETSALKQQVIPEQLPRVPLETLQLQAGIGIDASKDIPVPKTLENDKAATSKVVINTTPKEFKDLMENLGQYDLNVGDQIWVRRGLLDYTIITITSKEYDENGNPKYQHSVEDTRSNK